ncbi:hypothetical protein CONCODRAFT_12629 [Conidiobolus coronatus NRRL 28638]|uniref:F-box domain-containing protein n=1 Tax=Conidiobolus coronatus (strain ATCC 28846 / CBS 209.66 / NRRL 28638) TaxID=796925 RepID=A0A137NSM8_CONC2|nr:hypothetical protein CONCODRAFT_12629 [Conidiobolus coronatus NRRL 28638]|eukprot:KXN65700.1 hypothetical protein CONCODRAFT_12629 [Conidiobolus coronatus NRRL 28638]
MARLTRSSIKKNKNNVDTIVNMNISQKFKDIKKQENKKVVVLDSVSKENSIFNINSILSIIISYTNFNDLVELSTVCKRWNQLSNPIIHRSVKLMRSRAIQNKVHNKKFNKVAKSEAEVNECISNLKKFAPLVKEFRLKDSIGPNSAIEFFNTFNFITILTITHLNISQDQFILNMMSVAISKIIRKRIYKEAIQLPSSLTKLTLEDVYEADGTDIFHKTINSHKNLIEFRCNSFYLCNFIEPFQISYSTLQIFGYSSQRHRNDEQLHKIVDNNIQLKALDIQLNQLSQDLITRINQRLVNLEGLFLTKFQSYPEYDTQLEVKFSKSTKIKQLRLVFDKLSQSSLDSILVNCPQLNVLEIQLPKQWLLWTKSISSNCKNLEHLTIYPSHEFHGQELKDFCKEFYNSEFLKNVADSLTKLESLRINGFHIFVPNPLNFDRFKNFKNLKFVQFENDLIIKKA